MGKKVESKNQSGGITAFNVNASDNSQIAGRDVKTKKAEGGSRLAKIAIWVTIAAGIVAILAYLGLKP